MSRMPRAAVAVFLALLAALPVRAQDTGCHLYRAASFPMHIIESGRISVPLSIGGKPVDFLVDSGGVDSMLGLSVVIAQKMPVAKLHNVSVQMFGGDEFDHIALASNVDAGGLKAAQMRFLIMPDTDLDPGVGGLLAPDVLRAYDDDFDFANATFNLVSADHCPGQVVYWTKEYSAIDIQLDNTGHIMLQVLLDGAKFRVTIDTGAARSVLGLDEARTLFHFDEKQLEDLGQVEGIGHAYRFPFKTLSFGGVMVNNPDILLVPESDSHMKGSLIGIGVLRQLHLYLAYREQKMYVSAASAH